MPIRLPTTTWTLLACLAAPSACGSHSADDEPGQDERGEQENPQEEDDEDEDDHVGCEGSLGVEYRRKLKFSDSWLEVEELVSEINMEQLAECWNSRGRKATPDRVDALKERVNQLCLRWGGCDEQGAVRTDGCWGEATIRRHGAANRTVCGFYDRAILEECGPFDSGICQAGWILVDCHDKSSRKTLNGKKGSRGARRRRIFREIALDAAKQTWGQ